MSLVEVTHDGAPATPLRFRAPREDERKEVKTRASDSRIAAPGRGGPDKSVRALTPGLENGLFTT